jgi:hypothetical protein
MMKSLVTQVVTLAAVFLVVASSNTVAATEEENKEQQHPLLKWLFQHDGASFDSDTQRIATDDNTIFATHDIPQGSVLATIPWSATIGPDDDDEDDDTQNLAHFHCGTARALNQELQHGDTSPFKPYLEHLQSLSPKKRLPSQYSPPAKALLLEILGGEDSSSLLMERAVHYDFWEWKVLCGETNNEEDEDTESSSRGVQGAMWVQQHAFDDRMIPLKDFYTHRNGHYHNTDLKLVPGQYVQIVARRDIQSGEQLHTSYTECELCNEKIDEQEGDEYGTPGEYCIVIKRSTIPRDGTSERYAFSIVSPDRNQNLFLLIDYYYRNLSRPRNHRVHATIVVDSRDTSYGSIRRREWSRVGSCDEWN